MMALYSIASSLLEGPAFIFLVSIAIFSLIICRKRHGNLVTKMKDGAVFDFIVVGAGSAGCALASRLSEDKTVSVLLIEAGGEGRQMDARIPLACGKLQGAESDWKEFAEPQGRRACSNLVNGRSYWPRGKCLGGSSVLNYMAYVRGHFADFDSWANIAGDSLWGWDSVKAIFKRMENCSAITKYVEKGNCRGMGGPLDVSIRQPVHFIAETFVAAVTSLGYEAGDYNGSKLERVSVHQTTTKHGSRHSSADAYIWPILDSRPNLTVLLSAQAIKLDLREDVSSTGSVVKATGVVLALDGNMHKQVVVKADREVVVSASAVGSPHLLQLSGIGPKEHLEQHGIRCVVDSPEVGRNLNDHMTAGLFFTTTKDIGSINKASCEQLPWGILELCKYLFTGKGKLCSSSYDASLFCRTGVNPEMPFPDMQIGEIALPILCILAFDSPLLTAF
jgi:choline dehydrogenase